jgi:hypothetical protein
VDEAIRLVQEAVDAGITFYDNCWEYWNGRAEDWLGRGLKGRRDKVVLMTTGGPRTIPTAVAARNTIGPSGNKCRSTSDITITARPPPTAAPTAPARRNGQSILPREPDCSPIPIFRPSRVSLE